MRTLRHLPIVAVVAASLLVAQAVKANEPTKRWTPDEVIRAQAEMGKAQAEILKAQASLVQNAAEANMKAAVARKTLEECRTIAIQNDVKAVEARFQKRELREAYLAKHPRPTLTPEQAVRNAKQGLPARLVSFRSFSDSELLPWPVTLQGEEFAEARTQLDSLFANRTSRDHGVGSAFYREVNKLTTAMSAQLQGHIRELPPAEFLQAANLLKSLRYEAQLAPNLPLVAAN